GSRQQAAGSRQQAAGKLCSFNRFPFFKFLPKTAGACRKRRRVFAKTDSLTKIKYQQLHRVPEKVARASMLGHWVEKSRFSLEISLSKIFFDSVLHHFVRFIFWICITFTTITEKVLLIKKPTILINTEGAY
ncbi:MAG: hypothetical protein LBC93_08415, partial [Synergistaceae bacterium]|nr:hypothetical protein [Synergistaceae bacterium]